jgi:hypothetical protein
MILRRSRGVAGHPAVEARFSGPQQLERRRERLLESMDQQALRAWLQ